MTKREPDAGRAARFPRGHCGRPGCRCTHTENCDHGWIEGQPYTHRGVRYAAPQEPCPACRPEAAARVIMGSIVPAEPQPVANPEPLSPADLWADA